MAGRAPEATETGKELGDQSWVSLDFTLKVFPWREKEWLQTVYSDCHMENGVEDRTGMKGPPSAVSVAVWEPHQD